VNGELKKCGGRRWEFNKVDGCRKGRGKYIIRRAAIDKDGGPSEEGELTYKTVVYRNRM
jgi:hypothetical protein